MDGTFLDLAADAIESELEENWQELYKVNRLFNNKVKKMNSDKTSSDKSPQKSGAAKEPPAAAAVAETQDPPASLTVIATVQENMKAFKVYHSLILLSIFSMSIVFTISIYCMALFRGGFPVPSLQMNSFLLQKPK